MSVVLATRPDGARGRRPRRAGRAGSRQRVQATLVCMKALVTGAGRVHRLDARRAAAGRQGARGRRHRLLHRLLPAGAQGSAISPACRPAAVSVSSRLASQDADLEPLLDGVTHVFHLAAQAGVRKSWGRDFSVYTVNNIEATQVLLEACVGRPLERLVYASSSSVYGDDAPIPMREDALPAAGVAVRRHEAGRRAALLPLLRELRRADRRAALLHGLRTAAAARHGVPRFLTARPRRRADHACTATASRRATSRSWPTRSRRPSPPATEGVPGRVYNIGGGSRVSVNQVLDIDRPRRRTRRSASRREPPQKGDMRDTYADTSLAQRRTWASRRRSRSKKGWPPSSPGSAQLIRSRT